MSETMTLEDLAPLKSGEPPARVYVKKVDAPLRDSNRKDYEESCPTGPNSLNRSCPRPCQLQCA